MVAHAQSHRWHEVDVPTHPLKSGRWVAIVAHIRCNATGEVRCFSNTAVLDEDHEPEPVWHWTEGNYGCDCNRHIFFRRAGGEEPDPDHRCGHDAFSVNLENPATGEIYYREFE
jgi:hypothetical protein